MAPKKPQQFSNDPEIMSLSSERKAIAQENSQIKGPSDRTFPKKLPQAFNQEEIEVSERS